MESFDDLREHRHRTNLGLTVGSVLGLTLWSWFLRNSIGDVTDLKLWAQTATWFTLSPFILASFMTVYRLAPYPQGHLGTAPHGQRPRPWREGNPAIRQPSAAGSWLMALFFLSFMGCVSMAITSANDNNLSELALPLMYVGLGLLFYMLMSQVEWIELDIDSLRIIRHRVIRGLQTSTVQPEQESVRALGVCRSSFGGPYRIFAFVRNGISVPISQENSDLKEIQFEAERLADQLMVPLLRGMENQASDSVARHLRSLTDEKLPVRVDWAPVNPPEGLAADRSVYPPID